MLFSQQRLVRVSFLFFLSLWLSLCSTEEPNEQRHAYYVALNVRIGSVKHSNEMKNMVSLFCFFLCFLGLCGFLLSLQLTMQCKEQEQEEKNKQTRDTTKRS